MSSFFFVVTMIALPLTVIFRPDNWYIPMTFALLCIALNIDDFRKQQKKEAPKKVQKQVIQYDPENFGDSEIVRF